MESIRVGIDLGTTNTLVSYVKNGKLELVRFPGGRMLPSVIYADEALSGNNNYKLLVGKQADKKCAIDPKNGVRSSKTYMGDFEKVYNIRNLKLTPTDVAVEILKEVKSTVLKKFKLTEDEAAIEAVITVPAYFSLNQKDETISAGTKAGLKVLGLITEPSAAAIYNINTLELKKTKIFVVDLGGGTFDISILEADADQQGMNYKPIAVGGDNHLGGDDFDKRLEDYMHRHIKDLSDVDLESLESSGLSYVDYYLTIGTIQNEAKRVKEELSEEESCEVNIPNIFTYDGETHNLEMTITREKYYSLCSDLFAKIMKSIKKIFSDNPSIKVTDIDKVILAGGSCYIPKVQADVEKFFGKKAEVSDDRSEMVVKGAGLVADDWNKFITTNSSVDVMSHSFGIAAVIDGRRKLCKILEAGQKYPCNGTKVFTTTQDYQELVTIEVFEAANNMEDVSELEDKNGKSIHNLYGSFDLDNIEKAKKGVPQIEVIFEYGADSRLTVIAEDLRTHAKKEIKIAKGQKAPAKSVLPIDIVLMIDVSTSMSGPKMNHAREAAYKLVNEILDLRTHQLSIVTFGDEGKLICNLTNDTDKLNYMIDTITANGWTNMESGLSVSKEVLVNSKNAKYIILVTDGKPCTSSLVNDQERTLQMAKRVLSEDVKIVTIGVGDGTDYKFLASISSELNDNKLAYHISDMEKLSGIFEKIIGLITLG